MPTIVIDPGHGGNRPAGNPPSSQNNATGPRGTLEKNLVLAISLKCRDALRQQGVTVVMTREVDENIALYDRAHIARDARAEVFVSIHFNGNSDASKQGTETYVYNGTPKDSDSYRLATLVQKRVVMATRHSDRGIKIAAAGDLGVLNPAEHYLGTAACLVELSFLTDPAEESRLLEDTYQHILAEAVSIAIHDYVSGVSLGAP